MAMNLVLATQFIQAKRKGQSSPLTYQGLHGADASVASFLGTILPRELPHTLHQPDNLLGEMTQHARAIYQNAVSMRSSYCGLDLKGAMGLLAYHWERKGRPKDVVELMEDQLYDMHLTSGYCPQGQIDRVVHVLWSLELVN